MTITLAGLSMAGALGVAVPTITASAATAASSTPECTSGDVTTSYRYHDAGAGHRDGYILVKNVSDHSCRTGGFGGISYVGHGNGTQVGAPARRTGTPQGVVLAPGKVAVSEIEEGYAGNYPSSECHPTKVDGFRIYIPNETRSQYVKHPTTACANAEVRLIDHKPYRHQYV